jgi:hypothetical protein
LVPELIKGEPELNRKLFPAELAKALEEMLMLLEKPLGLVVPKAS